MRTPSCQSRAAQVCLSDDKSERAASAAPCMRPDLDGPRPQGTSAAAPRLREAPGWGRNRCSDTARAACTRSRWPGPPARTPPRRPRTGRGRRGRCRTPAWHNPAPASGCPAPGSGGAGRGAACHSRPGSSPGQAAARGRQVAGRPHRVGQDGGQLQDSNLAGVAVVVGRLRPHALQHLVQRCVHGRRLHDRPHCASPALSHSPARTSGRAH